MILITGGTGLVGAHLLLELAKAGERVRALYRSEKSLEATRRVFSYEHQEKVVDSFWDLIEWVKADVLDVPALEKAFEGITSVYHCAAIVSFSPSDYRQLRKTNIEGTANIVNLCIAHQVQKLCYVSSIAAFDLKPGQKEINEESHWNKELNHSMYAISKYGGETEVWRASQEGVPVIIVNPGVIIGPGYWDTGSGVMFKRIGNGLKYHFPKTTGFVGVRDTVRAMIQLMASPISNEQFILVSQNLSFKEVLSRVAESLERPLPNRALKPWTVRLAWTGQLLLSLFGRKRALTRESVQGLFTHTYYNSDKIKQLTGFEFEPMASVIAETGEKYKQNEKED